MRCVTCGGATERSSSATEAAGGFVLRNKYACPNGHITETMEVPAGVFRRRRESLAPHIEWYAERARQFDKDKERDARIIDRLRNGWRTRDVAEKEGVSPQTVRRIAETHRSRVRGPGS